MTLRIWKTFSIILTASLLGCGGHKTIPDLNIKLYQGAHDRGGVERTQTGEFISCGDPAIDKGDWVSAADFRTVYALIQSCQKWPEGTKLILVQEYYQKHKAEIDHINRQ